MAIVECRRTGMGAKTYVVGGKVVVGSVSRTGNHWQEEAVGEFFIIDITNSGKHSCGWFRSNGDDYERITKKSSWYCNCRPK